MGLRDKIRGVVHKAFSGGGGPSSPKMAGAPAPAVKVPPPAANVAPVASADGSGKAKPVTDGAWYLEGQEDIEGWDQTNPGAEPGQTNLRK